MSDEQTDWGAEIERRIKNASMNALPPPPRRYPSFGLGLADDNIHWWSSPPDESGDADDIFTRALKHYNALISREIGQQRLEPMDIGNWIADDHDRPETSLERRKRLLHGTWAAELPATDEPAADPAQYPQFTVRPWLYGWGDPALAEGLLPPTTIVERSMPAMYRPSHYIVSDWSSDTTATPLDDLLAARELLRRKPFMAAATAYLNTQQVQALRTRWRGRQCSLALQAARLSKRYDAQMVVACAAFDRYYAHPTRRNSRKYNHLLRRACKTFDRYSGLLHYAERRERSAPDWLKEEATK